MIEMRLSKQVKAALPRITTANPKRSGHWDWMAHSVQVGNQECLVIIESNTGYAMLFVDLVDQDYLHFDRVWQLRLLAETLSIANLDKVNTASLQQTLMERSKDILLTDDHQMEQNKLFAEVCHCLKRLHERYGSLPDCDKEEFRWGAVINQARLHKGRKPYQLMREYCIELSASNWTHSMAPHTNLH